MQSLPSLNQDNEEYQIDIILEHRYDDDNVRKASSLRFLVQWQGYPQSKNSWLPWKNLRNCHAVEVYARNTPSLRLPRSRHDFDDSNDTTLRRSKRIRAQGDFRFVYRF